MTYFRALKLSSALVAMSMSLQNASLKKSSVSFRACKSTEVTLMGGLRGSCCDDVAYKVLPEAGVD
jgi:hypothetical protein